MAPRKWSAERRRPGSISTSAASGITFTATTLTTTNAINVGNAVRLILNGVDVTASLTVTGADTPATNVNFSFGGSSGSEYSLAANQVYDASIILQDSYNRWTTNSWTFDTFSDTYLARATRTSSAKTTTATELHTKLRL